MCRARVEVILLSEGICRQAQSTETAVAVDLEVEVVCPLC